MLTIDKIKATVSKYGKEYGIKSAYLFGSYAKGNAKEGSDVDLLIEKGKINTYKEYSGFLYSVEDELGTHVDLLTDKSIKPRFFDLIKNDRILLYGA